MKPSPDALASIRKALGVLTTPGSVVELRIPGDRIRSGYFDDLDLAAKDAAQLNGTSSIYQTLNPIDPSLLARAVNRIIVVGRKPTTSDKNILRYVWLPLDYDPVRASEISSTDAQHEAALARAREARAYLRSLGWPEPILADSGNGAHLLYRIALPNDAESVDLSKRCIQALSLRFSDDVVKVDEGVFNPARIWKVYGTVACKGDDTKERPHRQSKLLHVPDEMEAVSLNKLKALADTVPKPSKSDTRYSGKQFDLDRWISDHGLNVVGPLDWSGGHKWVFPICPWDASHGDRSAFIVRLSSGAMAAGCHHDSCKGDWESLRSIYEPGYRKGREEHQEGSGESRVLLARGDTLSVKPIRWTWKDYLARGKLHVLAGAIGAGKSTIAVDLAAVVTTGGQWPDGTKCDPGDVLVWSDEDDPEDTLLPRFLAAGGDPRRIHFVTGTVDPDGKRHFDPATDIPELIAAARGTTDLGLVIVDPVVTVVAGDSHKNTEVRRALRPLVGLASDIDAAVLGVTHHTKGTAGRDPVERITGSLAFGAYPRVTMAAARDGSDPGRRIFVRTKSNIGPDDGGWEYRLALTDVPGVPEVSPVVVARWGNRLEGSAKDLLASAEDTGDPEERDARDEAAAWLDDLLKDGPVEAKRIPSAAKQSGIAWRTVERAKARLGVTSRKRDFAVGWWWSLPKAAARAREHNGRWRSWEI